MRLKDAIASLQLGKKDKGQVEFRELCTVWSEQADDGPQAVPLPEYPRPQKRRDNWICLNGWWDYGIYPSGGVKSGGIEEADGKILVPFSPETKRSGVERTLMPGDDLWYRRTIENLYLPEGRRLILHFGAVDERCTVYWNGEKVGSHRNGYLPFSFDVTEFVKWGENELAVFVWDDTDEGQECRGKQALKPGGMFYHAQSGIWQTVWLEMVPEYYLKHLRITPRLEEEAVDIQMMFSDALSTQNFDSVVAGIMEEQIPDTEDPDDVPDESIDVSEIGSERSANGSERPEDGSDRLSAENADEAELSAADAREPENADSPQEVRISIGVFGEGEDALDEVFTYPWRPNMRVRIPISDMRLWSPEHPELYSLRIEAGEDVVDSYFAMRSFGVGADEEGKTRLLLNGEPYFFNGILDQGYWPETLMTAPADEAFVYDIMEMKKAGFNMLRKHVKIEAARWYYHCDRIGMVVWQDMVNGGGAISKMLETYLPTVVPATGRMVRDNQYELLARDDEKARERFERDIVRMIRKLYNCPCIGMWIPFNEGWGQFDALRITEVVRKADATRPVDHASGWFDQGGGDVRSVHNYFRDLTVEKDVTPFIRFRNWGQLEGTVAGEPGDEAGEEFVQEKRRFRGLRFGGRKETNAEDDRKEKRSFRAKSSGRKERRSFGFKIGGQKEAGPEVEMGWESRAFVISEYGGANCRIPDHSMSEEVYGYSDVTPEEFPQAFADSMEKVHALVAEGLCGAVYTQVSDIEEETNGLLTYDRKVRKL